MRTRYTFLLGLVATGCARKPLPPDAASSTPSPVPAVVAPADAGAARCTPLKTFDGTDPANLGLTVCTEPAAPGREGHLLITVRRAADGRVLWSDSADAVAQQHILGGDQDPPALQIVIVHHVETDDDDDDENDDEDAYYVVDFEYARGALVEVNRFRDSGD
ncbi:MAG TPA: hypothetical protein VM261_16795 [Kofleriaceae bacterium]|nr:hypothetical protein [Kofleriaceae bacterium]